MLGCMSIECYVLSGRGLCDGPIPLPEESYRLWCVILCDLETSRVRRPWAAGSVVPKNIFRIRESPTWLLGANDSGIPSFVATE